MFRPRVLSGYRRLLRARTKLFVGDDRAMAESRIAIKAEFIRNAILTNSTDIEACLGGVDEAETMLLHEIMRGTLNDRGNYGTIHVLLYLYVCSCVQLCMIHYLYKCIYGSSSLWSHQYS
jgi:hypothetical protein